MRKSMKIDEKKAVTEALKWCVTHTPYSIRQYMRVIELVDKYNDKAIYRFSKKQNEMYIFLTTALDVQVYVQEMEQTPNNKKEQK